MTEFLLVVRMLVVRMLVVEVSTGRSVTRGELTVYPSAPET